MDSEDVVNLFRDVDRWVYLAENAAESEPAQAAIYAQLALARAISGLATALVMHAEQ